MERKIGEIFEHKGEWYQCVEGGTCSECSFRHIDCSISNIGDCTDKRTDGVKVIFKKLEKVGEPYKNNGKMYQLYKTPIPVDTTSRNLIYLTVRYDMVEILLKQNQEDMEEKKLNLKEFDLEAAKAGKPVCTRDGRKARTVCFDAKLDKPIVALIEKRKGGTLEVITQYFIDGAYNDSHETHNDLMMLPEKYEAWVNLYESDNTKFAATIGSAYAYKTEKEAKCEADPDTVLATVRIEWEE